MRDKTYQPPVAVDINCNRKSPKHCNLALSRSILAMLISKAKNLPNALGQGPRLEGVSINR
jgi:hypothetical protein